MKKLLIGLAIIAQTIAIQAMSPNPEQMYRELAAIHQSFTLKAVPFEETHLPYMRDLFKKDFFNTSFDFILASLRSNRIIKILLAHDTAVGTLIYTDSEELKRNIDYLIIHKAYRGLHYAAYFMAQIEQQARDSGIKALTVLSTGNAINFYAKLGFKRMGPFRSHMYKHITSEPTLIVFDNYINNIFDN